MDMWNVMSGTVTVELTCAAPVDTLQTIAQKGIILYHTQMLGDLRFRCEIKRKDYRNLEQLTKKRGDTLKMLHRSGLFWTIQSLFRRKILICGFLLLLLLVIYLPTRILFVRVEGNEKLSDARIIEAAEYSGIRFWSSRREVRSEQVKNTLLGALPELGWAGVNTRGCTAVISVRERTPVPETEKSREVSSIVAAKDGVIESCTALEGNLVCQIGQAVKEGDVLISGYTDLGFCIRACRAEGEIYARTRHKMTVTAMSQCVLRQKITGAKHKYSLLVGKKRINLWKDSGIWQGSCDRMYEEYYITLPGGFFLPVAFVRETFLLWETEVISLESATFQKAMTEAARRYMTEQMVAGKILNAAETFSDGEDICCLEGVYLCSEMIGRVQKEKIGE